MGFWRRDRFLIYIIGLCAAAALDIATPEGIADWLIEVVVVWMASVIGTTRELIAVAILGSAVIAAGLLSSPVTVAPLWMGVVNRLGAICLIWIMVNVVLRRRAAEEEQKKTTRVLRVLEGLLPMCAGCKAIRTPAGEWRGLESYLSEYSEAKLTHSLCPSCAEKYMADES